MVQAECEIPESSNAIFDQRVSRRNFIRGTQAGALALLNIGTLAGVQNLDLIVNDLIRDAIPNNDFFKDATPLPQQELDGLLAEHREVQLPFSEIEQKEGLLFKGEFHGNGSSLYLRLPGIRRETPRLTVLDIIADNRYFRTGIVSSPDPQPKTILLGPMSSGERHQSTHSLRIFEADTREEHPITPDEIAPELWYPTNFTLRTLIDSVTPFTVSPEGNLPWDDCLVARSVAVFRHGDNFRFLGKKKRTAENSRYESLYKETLRTYDVDWETKTEVTPEGAIVFVDVQRAGHKTKEYDSDLYLYGSHPVLEVYTENGMVRPAKYLSGPTPYFADQQQVVPYGEMQLRSSLRFVDEDLQEVSFDELKREKRDPKTVRSLVDDFNKRREERRSRKVGGI